MRIRLRMNDSTRVKMKTTTNLLAITATLGLFATSPAAIAQTTGVTELVSKSTEEIQGNGGSSSAAISADGRYVAFESGADNLVPNDTNNVSDIFVHDRVTGVTERVSVSSTGGQADNLSLDPDISADGRYVTFTSWASSLVPDGDFYTPDIFVHDRDTGETTIASFSPTAHIYGTGSDQAAISADGRYVTFHSTSMDLVPQDTNGFDQDVFLYDLTTGQTTLISVSSTEVQSDDFSYYPSISGDGRYIAFFSYARNLVPGDTNGKADVFVRDRQAGMTERVSVASGGTQARGGDSTQAVISDNGRYVAYVSQATNLVPRDTNHTYDIFVYDRKARRTTRVSVTSTGAQADSYSVWPSISADGRYVAFSSSAKNLAPDNDDFFEDVFVRDRVAGTTTMVSVSSDGESATYPALEPDISADGTAVAFHSESSNLVPNDTNANHDVFVHDTTP
jgi:hypothetical protein